MADDDDAVAGHAGVELEGGDAESEGAPERGHRVLGGEPARPAMALEVEGRRGDGEGAAGREDGVARGASGRTRSTRRIDSPSDQQRVARDQR